MTPRSRSSLLFFLLLAFSLATSAARQGTGPVPSTNQIRKPVPPKIAAKTDLKLEEVWLAKTGPSGANSVDIRLTGAAPFGGTVRLSCRLANAGADLKIPFVVTYLVDGKAVGTDRINGLAAGRTALSAVLYQTQAAGTHKLRCEIDRENKVIESTKSNNALEISFAVAGPITPGPGATGVVEDKPLREPRTPPGGANPPAFPANEPPLASVSWGGLPLGPVDVPAALGYEFVVVAAGSTLTLLRTADLSVVKSVSLDGDIRDQPTTVLAGTGKPATFAASAAGTVYGIDQPSMTIIWQRNLRRASCTADGLTARPVVHVRRNASANFKARYPMDLVYVSTAYQATSGCSTGQNTDNRVHALQATDGLPVWTFNESGQEDIDAIAGGASLDAANDRLFFTSQRSFTATQSTVWALDVLTGNRVWSVNAGAMENSPALFEDRLLVASRTGLVSAIDRTGGELAWQLQIGQPPSPSIATMMAATFPSIGRAACVVMANGRVRLVKDNGNSGQIIWDIALPVGKKAVSRAAYEPGSDSLYVGADDGQVYQISAASGAVTANRIIDPSGTGLVGTPVIWPAGGAARLIAGSSKGTIAAYLLPWPTETFGP